MMLDLVEEIAQADWIEIDLLLSAVLKRYAELFQDWEVSTIPLQKSADRNEQIDRVIKMLQKIKKFFNIQRCPCANTQFYFLY